MQTDCGKPAPAFVDALFCIRGATLTVSGRQYGNFNLFNPEVKTSMKTSIIVAAIVAGVLSAPIVSAQDKHVHPKPGVTMKEDKQMSQMQENMKTMQQQMEKLQATIDPQERQKLMQEHMQAMQENMQAMHGMGGPMMMGSGQPGGMAMDGKKKMASGDMMQHHAMMEKRMDMMQMMMEQMVQHDQATAATPAK